MSEIKDYILANQQKYKEAMEEHSSKLRFLLKTEDVLFHAAIVVEFINKAKSLMSEDICKHLCCNSEEAVIELESIDIMEFLRV